MKAVVQRGLNKEVRKKNLRSYWLFLPWEGTTPQESSKSFRPRDCLSSLEVWVKIKSCSEERKSKRCLISLHQHTWHQLHSKCNVTLQPPSDIGFDGHRKWDCVPSPTLLAPPLVFTKDDWIHDFDHWWHVKSPTLSVINATRALASRCSRNQFFRTMIDSGIGQLAMYLRSACWRRTNNEWNPWGVSTPLTMKMNTLWKEPSSRGGECVRISGWGHGEMPSCHWLNIELSKWIENPKQDISPKVTPKIHQCSWTLPSPLQLT